VARPEQVPVALARLVLLVAVVVGTPSCPRPLPPPPPPPSLLVVGEVSSAADAAGPEEVDELRRALEEAADTLGRDPRLQRRIVVAASVASFERTEEGRRLTIRCEVSLAVSDERDGRLLVMPRGWVQSRGDRPRDAAAAAALDREVVRDAARNALGRLASVLSEL